jgi:hypothetical protein
MQGGARTHDISDQQAPARFEHAPDFGQALNLQMSGRWCIIRLDVTTSASIRKRKGLSA